MTEIAWLLVMVVWVGAYLAGYCHALYDTGRILRRKREKR